ncbi:MULTISPECIES: RagB/SusD family nutrient uptake outer membrane protein [Niastella]|uniref:RagB/SusD family nutrient uptake outer membrane protein n=1 Tax=Niastella soli TaxID=2821487 RepID=A0ABS3Z0U5_9BACT|nr:RagB/SusD family nutrient uptake outer membrane protein [Niastella soli]MBO9203791.1 RagB/SusD family nutrient uptake outer membrane protein [Niastella soli]
MSAIKKTVFLFAALGLVAGIAGCKKIFDVEPEQSLDKDQVYQNVYDADAAVLGLYGKFLQLAKQYVVLNELRADLMDVTMNVDDALKQINEHNVTEDNPYADPRPFYEIILNCNDILQNFDKMRADKKFKEDEYRQRYSDVAALRSWVYLQAGILYGNIPYITVPLETVNDVKNESNFPRLDLKTLIDTLVKSTEAIPFKDIYPASASLVTTVDGYNTAKFFINKKCLLGDLYLWRSAYNGSAADSRKAAEYYKDVMETGGTNADMYRVKYAEVTTNSDLAVGYWNDGRITQYDERRLVDVNYAGWRSMFCRTQDDLFNTEWLWMLYFDKGFQPKNPFIDLFSNRGGSYLLKPSAAAILNWNSQVQSENNFPYDARGKLSYKTLDNQPVITKYLYNYLTEDTYVPVNILEKPGRWFLYRAAQLHLRYSEAANRDGRHKIAYALVHNGIKVNFDNNPSGGTARDVGNTQQTFDGYPYNFDARMGDYPSYRAPWHRNAGVRGRAHLISDPLPASADSTLAIEDRILNESALELAFEGNRWQDLMRLSIRRNDPGLLASRVASKFDKAGNTGMAATIKDKLKNMNNWFLPFKWK